MLKATVQEMRRMYRPQTGTALTGWIPMHVFEILEKELREDMRGKGLRVIYRGPRVNPRQSMTRRRDAKFAVIYRTYGLTYRQGCLILYVH